MGPDKPIAAGVTKIDHHRPEPVVAVPLRAKNAGKLADLEEYHFFTMGIFHLFVPPGKCNPVGDFLQQLNKPIEPVVLKFMRPVFDGLKFYDHVLFGLPTEHWADFEKFMSLVAVLDRERNCPGPWYVRVRPQQLTIADPIGMDKGALVTEAKITSFGIDSNTGTIYLTQTEPLGRPGLFLDMTPTVDTVRMAAAFEADNSNPYGDKT